MNYYEKMQVMLITGPLTVYPPPQGQKSLWCQTLPSLR